MPFIRIKHLIISSYPQLPTNESSMSHSQSHRYLPIQRIMMKLNSITYTPIPRLITVLTISNLTPPPGVNILACSSNNINFHVARKITHLEFQQCLPLCLNYASCSFTRPIVFSKYDVPLQMSMIYAR